ncbi:ASCH domain-containing protein [Streptomyces goshikiensis]|uniref:ASCH domain-containing protein n=1 Tax=Streptomyces goshikiensis TaxID=1942 RepID=UPI0036869A45
MSDTTTTHDLNIYQRYFDLVASGTKTIEVRVRYPHLADTKAGDTIRFRVKDSGDTCEVRIIRVATYESFEALLDGEGPEKVNPSSSRDQQLTNIRSIYGPEKEALGALAIEIELIAPQAS